MPASVEPKGRTRCIDAALEYSEWYILIVFYQLLLSAICWC